MNDTATADGECSDSLSSATTRNEQVAHDDTKQRCKPPRWLKLRLVVLVLLLVGVFALGKTTGFIDRVDVASLQTTVASAGPWGVAVYVAAFTLGILVQIPGMLFMAAGILVYGKLGGYLACLVGSFVAVCVSFVTVRAIGGKAFAAVERPFVKKMLARLEERPIVVLVVLRFIFWTAPPLNYALALSTIRFRDYAIGSALGLVPPMLLVALLFDYLFGTPWVRALLF